MVKEAGRAVSIVAVFVCWLVPVSGLAQDADGAQTFGEALREGTFSLGLRYRYELVDDDRFADDAHASTLRSQIGYSTKPLHGFAVHLRVEDVTAIGGDAYANAGAGGLGNGVTDRPVVADPELTEIDQAYLAYSGFTDTELRAGRFAWNLDNQRFVGAVGWRQNHQSFDGLFVTSRALAKSTLTYAYLDNANRIFGDDKPMASHLLDARFELAAGTLAAYGYLLDYDRPADAGLSTATWGAAFTGGHPLGGGPRLLYDLELAQQRDHGDNPNPVDAGYLRGELGLAGHGLTAKAGYEVLEGNPGEGRFTTPLATLHKWNGWADKFLATPPDGLRDGWLHLGYQRGAFNSAAVYHRFEADHGGADYGSELDLLASYKSPWGPTFAVKAALYEADTFAFDTNKLWLWAQWGL